MPMGSGFSGFSGFSGPDVPGDRFIAPSPLRYEAFRSDGELCRSQGPDERSRGLGEAVRCDLSVKILAGKWRKQGYAGDITDSGDVWNGASVAIPAVPASSSRS